MFDGIVSFFKRLMKKEDEEQNKDTAKERLHLVLMQDRANVSADFLEMMKQEIIEVIKKYIDVDENAIDVRLENKANEDGTTGAPALYANIPIVSIKHNEKLKPEEEEKKEVKENTKKETKKDENKEKIEKIEKVNTNKDDTEKNKEEKQEEKVNKKEEKIEIKQKTKKSVEERPQEAKNEKEKEIVKEETKQEENKSNKRGRKKKTTK